jgi:hypothetical protein
VRSVHITSHAPDALKRDIATTKAQRVGNREIALFAPSLAPFKKDEKQSFLDTKIKNEAIKMIVGIIKDEKISIFCIYFTQNQA